MTGEREPFHSQAQKEIRTNEKIDTRPSSQKIYEQLKDEIFGCIIRPDEVLVIDDLARRFSVSRTPVREALLSLCKEGLLDARHRVGFLVTPVDAREIIETYSLRILLERESARLAASRIDEDALRRLEEMTRRPIFQHNREFHSLIAASSGWGVLADTLESLIDKSARTRALLYRVQTRYTEAVLKSKHRHIEIYEALRDRQEEEASLAMVRHLEDARERVLKALSIDLDLKKNE